ncbi:MAG: hypothetical protein WD070_12760 [Pirellulaceae bacterium]
MSSLSEEQRRFVEAATKVYQDKLKDQLETEHFGEVIAVEPNSGDYVLGKSFGEVDRACRERFGTTPVHIFRVGGGGAVKIGGTCFGRVS